jgi:hypothetical protein
MLGVLVGAALILGKPDPVAILSSIASIGAASAAFLTILEMQASRKLSARARIGFYTAEQPIAFRWNIKTNNVHQLEGTPTLVLRNTTSGTAMSVQSTWQAINKISAADLANANKILPADSNISIVSSGYQIVFTSPSGTTLAPVSGIDKAAVGDVGPGQEVRIVVPTAIANYAMLKWMALLGTLKNNPSIAPQDAPLFSLKLRHDNIYEQGIEDIHEIRFSVARFSALDSRGSELDGPSNPKTEVFEVAILPELWQADLSVYSTKTI